MKILLSVFFSLVLVSLSFAQQAVGKTADNFTASTLDGKSLNLEDLRGKVVVMTFWGIKCPICHSEIPKLNKVAEKYAGQDAVFLAPTMNNEAAVNAYLKKTPFNFTILPNSLGILLQYADKDSAGRPNMSYPAYFIIDQNGQITTKSGGWNKTGKIDSEVNRLLKTEVAQN